MRAAASVLIVIVMGVILQPFAGPTASADEILLPEAGRLEARDADGNPLGPCPLRDTDVHVDVTGRMARVTLKQRFHNTYDGKIEAVYTFPLSHRGAVDRMTMTVGDRVVVGEVKERAEARRIYEAARQTGYVASLLEQERPNIFTQSIANIEPGAEIAIEISYVEVVPVVDGVHRFDFPMVVAPRYIPGAPSVTRSIVPAELTIRRGIILRGPAQLTLGQPGELSEHGTLTTGRLEALLASAHGICFPGAAWWGAGADTELPRVWYPFEARYGDGSREMGWLNVDGTGQINGRWFYADFSVADEHGAGFAADTDQVPDASRVTPMPVRPPTRAGHTIDLSMTIDTGGPAIESIDSELHRVTGHERLRDAREPARRVNLALQNDREIPNRDFVLSWRVAGDTIKESAFVHRVPREHHGVRDDAGFFTLMLTPPDRVDEADVRARELIFVLDSSGSMEGFPIEKAKAVLQRAIGTMRDGDAFNIVTFNDTTEVLWDEAQPNTLENRAAAQRFVEARQGGGGTEMRAAVLRALQDTRKGAAKEARVRFVLFLTDGEVGNDDAVIEAVRNHAGGTRVFSVGIGNSPNRSLLAAMAGAGRGAADFITLEGDPDATIARFVKRIERPVLTNIEVSFDGDLGVHETYPALDAIPDLFDETPLVIHGRYAGAGRGAVTIRGHSGRGPYERTIELEFPEHAAEHDVLASLWARAKVDRLMAAGDRAGVVALGERYQIATKHTSFIAVERSRLTIDGASMLVAIPIEMPEGQSWNGTFGGDPAGDELARLRDLAHDRDALIEAFPRVFGNITSSRTEYLNATLGKLDDQIDAFIVDADITSLEAPRYHEISIAQSNVIRQIAETTQALSDARKRYIKLAQPAGDAGDTDGTAPPADEAARAELKATVEDIATYRRMLSELEAENEVNAAPLEKLSEQQAAFDALVKTRTILANELAARETAPAGSAASASGEGVYLVWDNDVISNGVAGRATSPPVASVSRSVYGEPVTVTADLGAQDGKGMMLGDIPTVGAVFGRPDAAGAPTGGVATSYHILTTDGIAGRDGDTFGLYSLDTFYEAPTDAKQFYFSAPSSPAPPSIKLKVESGVALDPLAVEPTGHLTMHFDHLGRLQSDAGAADAAGEADPAAAGVPVLSRIPVTRGFFNTVAESYKSAGPGAAPRSAWTAEQVTVLAVELWRAGKKPDAAWLAATLALSRPDFALGVELNDALTDEALLDVDRAERLDVVHRKAMTAIEVAITEARRVARLRQVLDERLWPRVLGDATPVAAGSETEAAAPLRLSIMLVDRSDATLAAVREAGLVVEARSASIPHVVGRVDPAVLEAVALAPGVRRIEPVVMTSAR